MMPMRAERDKLNAKTLALQLRMTESEYRLQAPRPHPSSKTMGLSLLKNFSCHWPRISNGVSSTATPGASKTWG